MRADTENIRRSFSRAATTYRAHSGLQREVAVMVAEEAAGLVASGKAAVSGSDSACSYCDAPRVVLDVGCGTGYVTGFLQGLRPGDTYLGCDISGAMLREAKENLEGDVALVEADLAELPFGDGTVDTVVSSLTYQWAPDTCKAFGEAIRVLKPGGAFLFSTLGPGTLKELRECWAAAGGETEAPAPASFKELEELIEDIEAAGLGVAAFRNVPVEKTYPGMMELVKTLKNIGASPGVSTGTGLSSGKRLKRACSLYAERYPRGEGRVYATYEVILVSAVNPG